MSLKDKSRDVTVELTGQSATIQTGRLAAKTLVRSGKRGRGKHDVEVLSGHEYSAAGRMIKKDRLIDRKRDLYKERVVDADSGEVIRDVEHPLSEHIGYGSAKRKVNDV